MEPNFPDPSTDAEPTSSGDAGKTGDAEQTQILSWLGEETASGDTTALLVALRGWVAGDRSPMEGWLETFRPLDEEALGRLERSLGGFLVQDGSRSEEGVGAGPGDGTGQGTDPGSHQAENGPAEIKSSSRFVILEPFREGSLGQIFVAHDTELNRTVALKQIKEEYAGSPGHRARFLLEAVITGQLEHPAIVPVYGLGFDKQGRPYYAMKMIQGQTLEQAIARFHEAAFGAGSKRSKFRDGSDELRRLLRHFLAMCDAIAYVHDRGVLHRDIKPANVILGAFGETVIIDWGVAKLIRHKHQAGSDGERATTDSVAGFGAENAPGTLDGWALGTPSFMSPEQAAGEVGSLGPPSDIHGLGATLYAILTGRPPVGGSNTLDILKEVREGPARHPRTVDPDIPVPLEAICLKAMARMPADRYSTALDLRDDLEHWLAGEPVSVLKESRTARLWRWVGRHQTGVSVAVVIAAAVIAVAGLVGYMLHRARLVEVLRRAEAQRHAERLREETERHTVEINDVTYVNAEKSAREIVNQKQPGWVARALEEIGRGAGIPTPMRSVASLRGLAIAAHGGFDLSERRKLTSLNSACLAFSPDGRRLAVGEHHRQTMMQFYRVQVFDVVTQNRVAEYKIRGGDLQTKRTGVSALAFSPDGRWLAAGSRSGTIQMWDTQITNAPPITLAGHEAPVRSLAFTPDGTTLVSASLDRVVTHRHNQAEWTNHLHFEVHSVVSDLALSADGKLLALASGQAGEVRDVSSMKTSRFERSTVLELDGYHEQVVFSPDGQTLVASDIDKNIHVGLGRGQTDRVLVDRDMGVAHHGDVTGLEFHPNGSLVASGSGDNTLKIWDLAADQLLFKMTVLTESVVIPAFSPEGRTLAVAASEGTTVYDVLGLDALTSAAIQNDPVRDFAFGAGAGAWAGQSVLATTTMQFVKEGPVAKGIISTWRSGETSPDSSVMFERNSKGPGPVLAFDANPVRPLLVHNGELRVRLYEVAYGAIVAEAPEKQSSALRFSPDGRRLWGVIDEERIVSWSVPKLTPQTRWDLRKTSKEGRIGLTCLAAGLKWVAAGSRDGRAYLLRASDGQKVKNLVASAAIQSIALCADESLAVCGLINGSLALFRIPSGEAVGEIAAHLDTVSAVAFSPDGTLVASASLDRTVGLWKVDGSSLSELFHISSPSGHPVLSVKFDSGGKMLGILVQNERAVRLWNLEELRGRLKRLGLDWE